MSEIDPLVWALIWFFVGSALLVMEVFIPSGGILGFLAVAAFVSGGYVAFSRDTTTGLAYIAIALFATPALVGAAFKAWPYTPMGRAFLGELPSPEKTMVDDPRRRLVGRLGIAKSKMLPSGAVEVDGSLVDAVSQGMAVEAGQLVIVQEVRGNRVVVRLATEAEKTQALGASNVAASEDLLARPLEDLGLESFDDPLS
ncbi:MAG: hypothetical protein KDA61_02365 [Planctomycetales bacterium]|nr:hypothetical protein [Planctomycetales bacterium]